MYNVKFQCRKCSPERPLPSRRWRPLARRQQTCPSMCPAGMKQICYTGSIGTQVVSLNKSVLVPQCMRSLGDLYSAITRAPTAILEVGEDYLLHTCKRGLRKKSEGVHGGGAIWKKNPKFAFGSSMFGLLFCKFFPASVAWPGGHRWWCGQILSRTGYKRGFTSPPFTGMPTCKNTFVDILINLYDVRRRPPDARHMRRDGLGRVEGLVALPRI